MVIFEKEYMTAKKIVSSLILGFLILINPLQSFAVYSQASAKTYLSSKTSNAWATIALSAIGENNLNLDYLKNISGSSAINFEAPILAITASGNDPKTFGSIDYVAKLKTFYTSSQLGDTTTVNDDIFGILALTSAGLPSSDEVISNSKKFILDHQNSDGGWGWSISASSDTNTTASAVMVLRSVNISADDEAITKAKNYLLSAQNTDGGFTYDPKSSYGTDSDISSTAWVILALSSLNIDPTTIKKVDKNSFDYLSSQQNPAGYFDTSETSFTTTQTAYAVLALSGKTLPTKILNSSTENFKFRIEGAKETVCSGSTQGPTALDIVKNASAQCGFTYNITATAYGPYLDKINTDLASGNTGWQYTVNNTPPSVGAADYTLKTGDSVLWYFESFDVKITRLTLSQSEITTGQNTQVNIEYTNDGKNWLALSGAKVYFGTQSATTDSEGKTTISAPDGYYNLFAEKTGYVRTNSSLLKVGAPSGQNIDLSITIPENPGKVEGATISFSVDTSNMDYGNFKAGTPNIKNIKISNTGNTPVVMQANVSGDNVFKDNLQLNSSSWSKFKASMDGGQETNVETKLIIPSTYKITAGKKTGQLIFWATPKQ
jgi:hypothetical protein